MLINICLPGMTGVQGSVRGEKKCWKIMQITMRILESAT
jgi:hypothetical protein